MTIGAVASGKTTLATGAVRFDAVGDKYSRSASGLGGTHTMCCWAKIVVDRNAITCFIGQDDASTNYYYLSTTADGTSLRRDGTSGAAFPSGLNMTVGTWVYMATVNDTSAGGELFGYKVAGGSWVQATAANATVTGPNNANTFFIGNNGFNNFLNGSIAAVKVWDVALTDAELQAEAATYAAVKTSGLWANYQFRNGPQTTDDSGLGKTLTAAGTLTTDSSGPPIT
jgi:hypothetical protein